LSRGKFLILGAAFLVLTTGMAALGQDIQVSIPPTTGAPGENVSIPIQIGNTTGSGIIAAEFTIQYDSQVLSAIDANLSGTIAADWFIQANTATPGEVVISMAGVNPLSGSGVLVNVRFSVSATARGGSTYLITFSRALLNEGTPNAVTSPGIFTVGGEPAPTLAGDANGDNRVDHQDVLKLAFSYNKNTGESGFNPWADFNSDGRVDRQDMIILLQNYGKVQN
jgi:hypothetical protein